MVPVGLEIYIALLSDVPCDRRGEGSSILRNNWNSQHQVCHILGDSYLKLSHLGVPSSLEATVGVKSGKHAVASNMHKQQKLDHC